MADSITSIGDIPVLWTVPSAVRDLTSSYVSAAKFLQFTGTKGEMLRIIDGIGQVVEETFVFTSKKELLDFINFFEARKGTLHKFWLPVWTSTFKLKEKAYSGETSIYIEPCLFTQSYQGYERVWILLKDGSKIVRQVTDAKNLETKEELFFDTALDRDISPDDIKLFGRFILVRFGTDELEFEHVAPNCVKATVKFHELVQEYSGYDAEANQFAELYEFYFPGGKVYYYTSFYKDIEYNYQIYSAVPMKRGRIEGYVNMFHSDKLEITSRPTKALREYVSNSTLLYVKVLIFKLDLASGERKLIFAGTGRGVSMKDDFISLSLSPISSVFDFKIPKFIYQTFCNNILFDKRCGLARYEFEVKTSVIMNSDGSLTASAFSEKPDGWFTGGFVSYEDEYRLITNHSGDTIYLQAPFNTDITGKIVRAYPGCDGSPSTCKNKFNNLDNFTGFPYIPSDNPVVWGIK